MVKILNSNQSDNSTADAGAVYVSTGLPVSDGFTIKPGHYGAWFNPETLVRGSRSMFQVLFAIRG